VLNAKIRPVASFVAGLVRTEKVQ